MRSGLSMSSSRRRSHSPAWRFARPGWSRRHRQTRAQTATLANGFVYGTTLVRDTFTDGDGTPLPTHTPDVHPLGAGWTCVPSASPTPTVQGGRVGVTPGPGHLQCIVDSGANDVTAAMDYVVGTGAGMG